MIAAIQNNTSILFEWYFIDQDDEAVNLTDASAVMLEITDPLGAKTTATASFDADRTTGRVYCIATVTDPGPWPYPSDKRNGHDMYWQFIVQRGVANRYSTRNKIAVMPNSEDL